MTSETPEQYIARMRRQIREFYRLMPWAFEEAIRDYKEWISKRPEGRPGTDRGALAWILAEWLLARERRIRKTAFIAALAARPVKWSSGRQCGVWANSFTIETKIRDAQALLKRDPDFADEVDSLLELLRFSRAGKGGTRK